MSAKAKHQTAISSAPPTSVADPALLNSERIKARFGSYGIEILGEFHGLRQANLYSREGGDKVCRTFALVRATEVSEPIAAEHSAIAGGRSIGATFRDSGWDVVKRTRYTGVLEREMLGNDLGHAIAELMRLDPPVPLAVHAYELIVERENTSLHYASILELHHPAYLDGDELARLFPVAADSTINPALRDDFIGQFGLTRGFAE
ncbi:MAG: hypothetical protein V2I25_11995 [Woeseiaceae bacterium]|jgi:hypothetical protein|nr:hypothetical protein [Woeseiaceae bacterium]